MAPATATASDERGVSHPCWTDCQRQQILLFGHLQMLQFSITAGHDSVTNKDGQKKKESNEIQKLRTQLFDNLCTALVSVNDVMGDAISSCNASIQSSDQLAKLQKICKQTSSWASLLKDGKVSEEIKMKNEEDEDLVIDEDIVILGGKKPREIDLLCPISRKPFIQPMIK
jgi:hypothetical protein